MTLLQSYNAREITAFNKIFAIYYNRLNYFTLGLISDRQVAEEIVSDVMMKAWRSKTSFETIKHLQRLLFKATQNKVYDYYRRTKLKLDKVVPLPSFLENEPNPDDPRESDNNYLRVIYAVAENLPAQRRLVFRKIYLENAGLADIAEELNINIKTVSSHKAQALAFIRKTLIKVSINDNNYTFLRNRPQSCQLTRS